jgi:hypothetical protein
MNQRSLDLGASPSALPPISDLQNTAVFSECRLYRYYLKRVWDETRPVMAWICLNPSKATETVSDPSVRRMAGYAWDWGYGGFIVGNAFAYRSTDPAGLKTVVDPVGLENDAWIERICHEAHLVVCGWGNHGLLWGRGAMVLRRIRQSGKEPHALAITGKGQPQHPLYLKASLRPAPMREAA